MIDTPQPESWKNAITHFLLGKRKKEEEKFLKEQMKEIEKYFAIKESKDYLDPKKNKKDKNQSSIQFHRKKFRGIAQLEEKPEELNYEEWRSQYILKCIDLRKKYFSDHWIEEAAKNASNVSFATHVSKLTHSKINSPSFLDLTIETKDNQLSTASLKEKAIDGAVDGNQFAPIFQFLELQCKGQKLAPIFSDSENQVLLPFTSDENKLKKWNQGFKTALSSDLLSTHFLMKQVYFPIKKDNFQVDTEDYHLLCNVQSSSLAQAINERIFDPESKAIYDTKKKKKYSEANSIYFINKLDLGVTASNHCNASQLNAKRRGKLNLLSAQPPSWENQLKPPIYKNSLFISMFSSQWMLENIKYLRDFLIQFNKIELSIQNPQRRKWVDRWSGIIIGEIFDYISHIHTLPAGWSADPNIKLKQSHQFILDPYRKDEKFQNIRKTNDWQVVICNDFANWLNSKLIGKDKQFTPQKEHSQMWTKLIEKPLRELNETIKLNFEYQTQES